MFTIAWRTTGGQCTPRNWHYLRHVPPLRGNCSIIPQKRSYSSPSVEGSKRSYLYGEYNTTWNKGSLTIHNISVPASSDKMLNKSLVTKSDMIVYDLEDSVPPSVEDKEGARNRLARFIHVKHALCYESLK